MCSDLRGVRRSFEQVVQDKLFRHARARAIQLGSPVPATARSLLRDETMKTMGIRHHVAVACVLAACVRSHLVPCGDKECPSNTTCVGGEICATDEEIAACNALADGDSCSVGAVVGRC